MRNTLRLIALVLLAFCWSHNKASAQANPNTMGDFPSKFGFQTVTTTQTKQILIPFKNPVAGVNGFTTRTVTETTTTKILVPLASQGAFKIAENESPRPQDRIYVTWNYFNGVQGPATGSGGAILGQPPIFGFDREVLGFEKTFLDGNGSVGLRLPFFQTHAQGDQPIPQSGLGDVSLILKYAPWYNRDTGNLISGGLVVTLPTGTGFLSSEGNIHSTLLQPYVGFIYNLGNFYVQGFSSVVVPTDERDVTLSFNDIGVGFWAYRSQRPNPVLRSVIATVETHVTTPLNHGDNSGTIVVPDLVVMTGGVHFGLGANSYLSLGVATPVSGPRLFNYESLVQFNLRF